ncbi:MAG: HAMP domain-containing sensor histidine kinase [Phycisphaerales bacterium]
MGERGSQGGRGSAGGDDARRGDGLGHADGPGIADGAPVAEVLAADARAGTQARAGRPPGGLLGGMRIRKKLIVLHTCFSLALAAILLVSLRPAVAKIMDRAEVDEGTLLLRGLARFVENGGDAEAFVASVGGEGTTLRVGTPGQVGISEDVAARVRAAGSEIVRPDAGGEPVTLVMRLPAATGSSRAVAAGDAARPGGGADAERFAVVTARIGEAREAVVQLFVLLVVALLAVYGLVALALEVFVMPQHVYDPIRRMREADEAVRAGRRGQEQIPEALIPRDELGEIMRSRNESIRALREHESALAAALAEIERVATDLKRKNHLLERAQQNLRDADRLASLGMMSAGIAHELNTPLAVLKGLVERLSGAPRAGMDPAQAALMLRVVKRLERLGESLLDFARVRPPESRPARLRELAEEAMTLARLDREAGDIAMDVRVPDDLVIECDADRMVQVLVNLTRNAVDAIRRGEGASRGANAGASVGHVAINAELHERDDGAWATITVVDDGPGIDPDVLPRLFEPFASTTLDARGTGLGLAVSEGIVREHGGVILAKNRTDGRSGAVFEVLMPQRPVSGAGAAVGFDRAARDDGMVGDEGGERARADADAGARHGGTR